MNNVEGRWLGNINEHFSLKFGNVSVEISFVNIAELLGEHSRGYSLSLHSTPPHFPLKLLTQEVKKYSSLPRLEKKILEVTLTSLYPPPEGECGQF